MPYMSVNKVIINVRILLSLDNIIPNGMEQLHPIELIILNAQASHLTRLLFWQLSYKRWHHNVGASTKQTQHIAFIFSPLTADEARCKTNIPRVVSNDRWFYTIWKFIRSVMQTDLHLGSCAFTDPHADGVVDMNTCQSIWISRHKQRLCTWLMYMHSHHEQNEQLRRAVCHKICAVRAKISWQITNIEQDTRFDRVDFKLSVSWWPAIIPVNAAPPLSPRTLPNSTTMHFGRIIRRPLEIAIYHCATNWRNHYTNFTNIMNPGSVKLLRCAVARIGHNQKTRWDGGRYHKKTGRDTSSRMRATIAVLMPVLLRYTMGINYS